MVPNNDVNDISAGYILITCFCNICIYIYIYMCVCIESGNKVKGINIFRGYCRTMIR